MGMGSLNMRRFIPLIVVELYLLLSLLLLYFGPVRFQLHNSYLFLVFLVFYHFAFILGYFLSVILYRPTVRAAGAHVSGRGFYLLFFFGVASIFLSYKNLMMYGGLI